jgi:hypothetical protein
MVALGTHEVVKELKAASFSDEQAEAVTRVVRRAQDLDLSHLATKQDLAALELRMDAKLSDNKTDTLKWVLGAAGLQTIVTVGAVVALVRHVPA